MHLNFTMIFGKKKYFSKIISKEYIIASLFIINAILNPVSATFYIVLREYFRFIFNVKKCTLYSIKYDTCLAELV